MKNLLLALVLFLSLVTVAQAQSPSFSCTSSGLLISDGAISGTGTYGLVCGIVSIGDGSNASSCTLYDNPSGASGTVIFKVTAAAGDYLSGGVFPIPVRYKTGLYLDAGSNSSCIVYYNRR